jgi:hypothetical protein
MDFNLDKSLEILERTPAVLQTMPGGLSGEWIFNNEGENTWSPYDIIGHLIHGEKTDWVVRTKIILSDEKDKTFIPFDRFAQFKNSEGKSMQELLDEFAVLRKENLDYIKRLGINEEMLNKTGIHPEFGTVTLRQLLAAWTAHDLNHIAQIARVMAKQYKHETGPWLKYLPLLNFIP